MGLIEEIPEEKKKVPEVKKNVPDEKKKVAEEKKEIPGEKEKVPEEKKSNKPYKVILTLIILILICIIFCCTDRPQPGTWKPHPGQQRHQGGRDHPLGEAPGSGAGPAHHPRLSELLYSG